MPGYRDFHFRVASPLDPAEKQPLQGVRLGVLGAGPGHPRLGFPPARRFSSIADRAARRRCSRDDATRKWKVL